MNQSLPLHELTRVFLLSIPLIVGGVLHMIAVKADILSYLKIPIHQRWFGNNKTWRGILVMLLATWPGVILGQQLERVLDLNAPLLTSEPSWLLAICLGLGYCLAELPNSFIKRRLGIKEGQTSSRYKMLFIILDQADSAIGCMLAYWLIIPMTLTTAIFTIVFGTVIHLLFNLMLYQAGIRKNRF